MDSGLIARADVTYRPVAATYNRSSDTVRLAWADWRKRPGEFCIRGGVAWPKYGVMGIEHGAICIVGYSVEPEGTAYVFDEALFTDIDHWILSDGTFQSIGLCDWLNGAVQAYRCYQIHDMSSLEEHREWTVKVARCDRIIEKPRFLRLEPPADVRHTLETWDGRGALVYPKDGPLDKALRMMAGSMAEQPAAIALATALASFDRFPWQGRKWRNIA